MDDITSKITELLQDPEGMQKISTLANSLMKTNTPDNTPKSESGLLNDLPMDPEQIGSIMKMMSLFKQNNKDDDTTKLLIALKPHLSEERKQKVDKAISLLKIVKVLPILKENGLLNLLGG